MNADPGYFGPNSMMWKVNKEITVLFGGARALLMHAAHPLIAAGARQTSFYQRDPWKRLIRTLSLQNSVTFGTKEEANELYNKLWLDHIPRDPRDQFNKMMSMNTLVKTDFKYEYICNDCDENWISNTKNTLCTCCLSPNIKEITNE